MHRVAAGNFIVNITFGWEHAVAITDKNDAGKLVSHRFPQFSFAEGMVPEFFRYVIVDEKFRHHLWLASPGGAGRNRVLKLDEMLNYLMRFPSRDEQIKIAEFFRHLDNLITLHQRQLFLHSTPDISLSVRLIHPFYTSSWEQRKVSDLAEKTYGGGTPTTSNEAYWNGDIPWIQSSDVVDGKLLGVEPRKWITQDGLNNSAAQLIPGNSIAIITRVGVGKLAFIPYSYATSQDFLSLSKLNAEPLFTVYACYKKLQSELNAVQGTSIKGITKDELLAKNIMVPRYAEQQQIGAFFKQLDNLITLHQRKGKAAVSGCFLKCFSLEKSSAQSRTLELFGQISNQEIKYIIDGLSILGGKLRNFCVKLIILLSYTRINDIAKYHISRNTECVHNIN